MDAAAERQVFVGRGREVDEILGLLATAQSGTGRALAITGEGGIGKTSLAERAASLARGMGFRVVWTSSFEDVQVPGFWVWRDALRQIAGNDAVSTVAWPEVAPTGDVAVSYLDVFGAIRDVLWMAAERQPLVLVLDDAQWMDSGSARLLHNLARQIAGHRILLLATARPGAESFITAGSGWRQIELAGLQSEDIREFLQSVGAPSDNVTVTEVLRSSGGNALYVQELGRLRAAGDHRYLTEGIRNVILGRLEQLDPSVRDAIGCASVAGVQFTVPALAAMLECSPADADDRLTKAARAGIVVLGASPGGSWEFHHGVTRRVAYESLPYPARCALHRRLGSWLEAQPGSSGAEVARHLRESGDPAMLARVVDLERTAAETAFGSAAFAEAAGLFRSAATTAQSLGDRQAFAELTVRAGEAQRAAGAPERGRPEFLAALPLVEDSDADLFARCVLGLSPGRMDLGFAFRAPEPEVVHQLRRATAARHQSTDHLTVRLMSRLAAELYFSGERAEALALAEDAVKMARAGSSPRGLADALATFHDIALAGTADAATALDVANELITAARAINDDEALLAGRLARLLDLLALGRRTEVEGEIAAFEREAAGAHRAGLEWFPAMWKAMLAIAAGTLQEAEQLRMAALQTGLGPLGELAFWNGSFQQFFLFREQDQLMLMEGLTRSFAVANPEQPALACGLAFLLAETGKVDEARVELDRLSADQFAIIGDRNWPISWFLLAETAILTGAAAHGAELYKQGLPFASLGIYSSIGATWVGPFSLSLGNLAVFLGLPEASAHSAAASAFAQRAGFLPWIVEAEILELRLEGSGGERRDRATRLEKLIETATTAGWRRIARLALKVAEGPPPENEAVATATMTRTGRVWAITWQGGTQALPDSKGLQDIAALLRDPGVPRPAIELATRGLAPSAVGQHLSAVNDGLERLDRQALGEYRERLRELDAEISEAEDFADSGRLDRLRDEREFLLAEVRSSLTLAGRPRSERGDRERARKAVEMRVSAAIERIEALDEALGQHLRASIRTGGYCEYRPATPVEWDVSW